MSHTQTRQVFYFNELSDEAKECARNWYRNGALDYQWWEFVYEDAKACAALIGIEIDTIYFSGFWSQGDGACFEGSYNYKAGGAKAIRKHAPQDMTLHSVADDLQTIQRPAFYGLEARVIHRGHYYHENCTSIDIYNREGEYASVAEHDGISEALRDFMRWIYNSLEREFDYLNSDEVVDESIISNEYEFTKNGTIY